MALEERLDGRGELGLEVQKLAVERLDLLGSGKILAAVLSDQELAAAREPGAQFQANLLTQFGPCGCPSPRQAARRRGVSYPALPILPSAHAGKDHR